MMSTLSCTVPKEGEYLAQERPYMECRSTFITSDFCLIGTTASELDVMRRRRESK